MPAAPDEDRPEDSAPAAAPAAPAPSAKAKRKAALSKANAEGPKGTLLDAFTGPPPTAVEPHAEPVKEMPKQMPPPAASPPAPAPEKVIMLQICLQLTIRLGDKVLHAEYPQSWAFLLCTIIWGGQLQGAWDANSDCERMCCIFSGASYTRSKETGLQELMGIHIIAGTQQ